MNVSGGTLTSNSGTSTNSSSYGVFASSAINVTGGELNSKANTADNGGSYGIYTNSIIKLSGGSKLTGTADSAKTSYGVYSGGNITVEGSSTFTGTAGTATNDKNYGVYSGSTITVTNSKLNGKIDNGSTAATISYGICASKVAVSGASVVNGVGGESTATTTDNGSYGMYVGTDLTVSDSSSVTAAADKGYNSYGLHIHYNASETNSGNITVSGTATVTGDGGEAANESFGVYASSSSGTVTVSGTASLTGNGGVAKNSYGVYSGGAGISAKDSARLTGTGANVNLGNSYGIYTQQAASIINASGSAEVKGNSGTSAGSTSAGIYYGGITADGGTVIGTGNQAQSSYGISLVNNIKLTNGAKVEGKGGKATTGANYGISIRYNGMDSYVTDSTLIGTCEDGTTFSYGIYKRQHGNFHCQR